MDSKRAGTCMSLTRKRWTVIYWQIVMKIDCHTMLRCVRVSMHTGCQSPESQERDRLTGSLRLSVGFHTECNMLIAIILLGFICFDPKWRLCTGSLYKLHIFLCTVCSNRWVCCRSDGFLAVNVSRDSLQYRRQPVAYLLCCDISIETDWPFFFSLHYGCFLMSEEPFAGPTLTFIRRAEAQIYRISE